MQTEQSQQERNSANALINQTKKHRYANQRDLRAQVEKMPGDTATQAGWRFAGFHVNEKGECVSPNEHGIYTTELYSKIQVFLNAKRRLSEMAGAKIKNPKLQTAEPRINPHADGVGLYPIGMSIADVEAIANGHLKKPRLSGGYGAVASTAPEPENFGVLASNNIGALMDSLDETEGNN